MNSLVWFRLDLRLADNPAVAAAAKSGGAVVPVFIWSPDEEAPWQPTGWMHNRVRMIVASFFVKDLLMDWREGAQWFWDTLVDADLAQNTLGWQWTAGCGADAAPFFRVFNPTSQGEKFDPRGDYVRRWCPELAKLPPAWIHQPDQAPPAILKAAGVSIGHDYPEPIVCHALAREIALEALAQIKRGTPK